MLADVALFAEAGKTGGFAPGLYVDMAESIYHGDPCAEPSLSASTGKVLLNRSAKAFQWGHPRLRPAEAGPAAEQKWVDQTVFGTVVHKLVLGRGKDVVEVDAADWKTNASKQERADITVAGKVAILKHRLVEAKAIAARLRPHVIHLGEVATEVVLIWQDRATDGTLVWCRAMLDILTPAGLIGDLKITGGELSDGFVSRQVGNMAYDYSMAWYRRGLAVVKPELAGRIQTRLIFAERKEPFDVFPLDLTEGNLHVAERQTQVAIDRFAACMKSGQWPGVAPQPRSLEIPDWHQRQFLNDELNGEDA